MFLYPEFKRALCVCFCLALICNACKKINEASQLKDYKKSLADADGKMNIIFILEDDIGYEIPTYTGGQSYSTPQMDMLAQRGMQFTHCYSSAMCSPSRVMLMTGKYGFRNYYNWSVLDTSQKTIANMLHDAGYATCVTGKWQLDGHFSTFGFDEYSVFDPFFEPDSTDNAENKYRYKNPVIYQNGAYLPAEQTKGKYSDDMFANYATDFIDRNKHNNFFLYFSYSECHTPFMPPPNNSKFATFNPLTNSGNKIYFPYMVSYMDSKLNDILQKITEDSLADNTYIFIAGDNGTDHTITSKYNGRSITGGKTFTNEFGLHVPLIVIGPNIQPGSTNRNIVDFSDFLPTIADIAGISSLDLSSYGTIDGKSFYNQFFDPTIKGRDWSYGYYFPYPTKPKQKRIYVQDTAYKLYDITNASKFFNLQKDSLEAHAITVTSMTPQEKIIKNNFKAVLAGMHN